MRAVIKEGRNVGCKDEGEGKKVRQEERKKGR